VSDAQLTAVIAALSVGAGAFVTFLKWAFSQWMADRKEDRAERKVEREADRAATIEMTRAITTMCLKFDAFEKKLDRVEDSVEHVADEVTGNHRIPKSPQRAQTAPLGGYGPRRPRQDTP
jgi:hypothetical protein